MPRFSYVNVVSLFAFIWCGWLGGTSHAEKYLFLVGVQDYSQTGELTSLRFAETDVHVLASRFFRNGVPESNIVLMTQRMAAKKARWTPRSDLIMKELDLILNLLRSEDSIIVGFSGHGLQFKGDDTNYFCPLDAKPDTDHKDTLVSLTDVYLKLEKCKANTKLLLVDACRNDPLSSTAKAARQIEIEPVFSRPAPVFNGGTIAIFSCSESEQSFEHPDLMSGLFFHFVNRALAGEADADDDNVVDLGELENFAIKNVQKWAQTKLGKSQTPESCGTKRGAVELVRLDRKVVSRFPPQETMPATNITSPSLKLPKRALDGEFTNSIGMKFRMIRPGTFLMGSPGPGFEGKDPQHSVTISEAYYLGTYEVTQQEYERVMGTNPSEFKGAWNPVDSVSWLDAVAFIEKLNELPTEKNTGRVYRLPTEAEWEYASRAGSKSAYCFGDTPIKLQQYAWSDENSGERSHPVGEKMPNAWGLYDMHGNVEEWCYDWKEVYPSAQVTDPSGPSTGWKRVTRGGSWLLGAASCTSADRSDARPDNRKSWLGFRVALISSSSP